MAIATLIGLLYWIYSLAYSFGISFDDYWNLEGLAKIHDRRSALEFVFGGVSGPLGRPLALLSFLPSATSWPSAPEDFLFQNTSIHAVNALLVMWLTFRLARHLPWKIANPQWMAVSVAGFWAFSPLLFSTNMMIIQRMTSLGALFCLAGLIAFLAGFERLGTSFWTGILLMAGGIGLGTVLAVLCKENGALLPGFALAIDALLLRRSKHCPVLRVNEERLLNLWRIGFLVFPVAVIIAYLVYKIPDYTVISIGREYTLPERLLTETRIVLDYLRLLLLPVRSELAPYQDGFEVSRNLLEPVSTLVSVLVLSVLLGLAWFCRRTPLLVFTFALVWFLWGQLLESTVVPLELYFQHRNYLPAVGLYFALGAGLFHPACASGLRALAVLGLLINFAFVLRETALSWRDPLVASALWHQEQPRSLRALQLYVRKLQENRRYSELLTTLENVQPPLADSAEFAMIRLSVNCDRGNKVETEKAFAAAMKAVSSKPFVHMVTKTIDRLAERLETGRCPGFGWTQLFALLDAALANPDPQIRADTRAQGHEIYARLMVYRRNLDQTMYHLETAFALRPTISTGVAMVAALLSAELYDEARDKLKLLDPLTPSRPYIRARWRRTVQEMREIIDREERNNHQSHERGGGKTVE